VKRTLRKITTHSKKTLSCGNRAARKGRSRTGKRGLTTCASDRFRLRKESRRKSDAGLRGKLVPRLLRNPFDLRGKRRRETEGTQEEGKGLGNHRNPPEQGVVIGAQVPQSYWLFQNLQREKGAYKGEDDFPELEKKNIREKRTKSKERLLLPLSFGKRGSGERKKGMDEEGSRFLTF